MGQVVVVRHGQASIGGVLDGSDYDRLSELGLRQAVALGEYWGRARIEVDAVFSGPAKRHVGTEGAVRDGVRAGGGRWPAAVVLPELDEHDGFSLVTKSVPHLMTDPDVGPLALLLGKAAGRDRGGAFQKVFEVLVHRWIAGTLRADDVEPFSTFRDRVLAGLDRLVAASSDGRRVVAVSSVGPIAVMLARVLDVPPARAFETAWRLRNAGITSFVHGRGRFTLDGFNATPHLPDPDTVTFR
jgi:broad specificity phosphatase PhoE